MNKLVSVVFALVIFILLIKSTTKKTPSTIHKEEQL